MSDNAMSIEIAKFEKKVVMWSYISIQIASKKKKLLRNFLYWVKLDDRGIATSLYSKKWEHSRGIKLCLNS